MCSFDYLCYAVLIAFESENEGFERGSLDSPLVLIYGHVSRQNGCFCLSCFLSEYKEDLSCGSISFLLVSCLLYGKHTTVNCSSFKGT